MNFFGYKSQFTQVIALSVSGILLLAISFTLLEPTISLAQTSIFTIRQQVTAELSFTVPAANVTMVGALAGITGGNATGTTYAVVLTNNTNGYAMDIAFSGTPAMRGEVTNSTSIVNYGSTTEPAFVFVPSTSAVFAYTVNASTTADLDQSFKNNGVACNAGAAFTANTCWMAPSTTNFRIISRSSAATTTATTTIQFRVNIPNNPVPAVNSDFYTATATLTLVAL